MSPAETIATLRQFNEWRRGCDIEHPPTVGKAIDTAIEIIERLEAAEKERDSTMRLADSLALALNTSNHERDALRAKIERMDEAMESLLIRCDDSDSGMYGTLSTSFVRDTVRIARDALEETK